MSQEVQVIQCFACQTFQTQIAKKSKKWICKICNEKQSLKKVYGQGSGKDCRIHCQQLNDFLSKKHAEEKTTTLLEDLCTQEFETKEGNTMSSGGSKWAKYLSQPSNSDSDDDGEDIRPSQLFLPQCTPESVEIPLAKKFKNNFDESQTEGTKNVESLFSGDDNLFNNVALHDNGLSTTSFGFSSKRQSSQEVDPKSKINGNERSNNESHPCKVNFDMFMDDLIDDKDVEALFDDPNIGKCEDTSSSKLENKHGNSSELNSRPTVKISNKFKIKQRQVNRHGVFKMAQSDELVVDELKRKVSLLEDINSYTLEQLTEMCKF